MGVPQIVIVGRPNVGKSSLFNWLAGRRLAIVDSTSGVTRDRVTQLAEVHDRFVELVDTGYCFYRHDHSPNDPTPDILRGGQYAMCNRDPATAGDLFCIQLY